MTKIPAPITAPIPRLTRFTGERLFFSSWLASASACNAEIGFVRKRSMGPGIKGRFRPAITPNACAVAQMRGRHGPHHPLAWAETTPPHEQTIRVRDRPDAPRDPRAELWLRPLAERGRGQAAGVPNLNVRLQARGRRQAVLRLGPRRGDAASPARDGPHLFPDQQPEPRDLRGPRGPVGGDEGRLQLFERS